MKKIFLLALCLIAIQRVHAQQKLLTPELLWSIGRVSPQGLSKNKQILYYAVSTPQVAENKLKTVFYQIPALGGTPQQIAEIPGQAAIAELDNASLSQNGNYVVHTKEVAVEDITGKDRYPLLQKSNGYVYDNLNQRHWDTWEDGKYTHVFVARMQGSTLYDEIDIMEGEKFDCPQKPHGGAEDVLFAPDNETVIYVTKKLHGTAYAISTNTDIYAYHIPSQTTQNLTSGMNGYDTNPSFSKDGTFMGWLSMQTPGCESDKNDIWIMDWATHTKHNLTAQWDETIESFYFSEQAGIIYFVAPVKGTVQLFELMYDANFNAQIKQITHGNFDITSIIGEIDEILLVTRTDINRAAEIFKVHKQTGFMQAITHVNDRLFESLKTCDVQQRYTHLPSGENIFSWVIYPPDFDPAKKYPMLLYCQGGPQSALTQFYSFRWNFQLMASQGYIVVAPNRTGMPGWGTEWNAAISKDWGGNPMRDYLAVVDDISLENYIDVDRRGAVGASYGGYSVFMLAGIHENRFKTFISHCGLFDLKSWYGTTEELWFANWDIGGPYWETNNRDAQNSYKYFSPSHYVQHWNTPIMIVQGGKDYRVPIEQGLQAFQAAQLKGLKSRMLYLPEENHWVLKPQNGLLWQYEFFKWLKETL